MEERNSAAECSNKSSKVDEWDVRASPSRSILVSASNVRHWSGTRGSELPTDALRDVSIDNTTFTAAEASSTSHELQV